MILQLIQCLSSTSPIHPPCTSFPYTFIFPLAAYLDLIEDHEPTVETVEESQTCDEENGQTISVEMHLDVDHPPLLQGVIVLHHEEMRLLLDETDHPFEVIEVEMCLLGGATADEDDPLPLDRTVEMREDDHPHPDEMKDKDEMITMGLVMGTGIEERVLVQEGRAGTGMGHVRMMERSG